MKIIKNLLFPLLAMGFAGNVCAGSASAKLSALAESLIKGYAAKTGASKTALAVFPLNCEEKLEKQRVGFAASEVMSHRFVADGAFTVVERGELGKLLSEQKLQASGVVDNETAVKLGKILGAGVILVGNIQKLGGKYQVNARLVDAETAEVLVSSYEELDSRAFEDDARVYLNLVPEEQTLGIYAVYNYGRYANSGPEFFKTTPFGQETTIPRAFSTHLVGGGLLYRPGRHVQINTECVTAGFGNGKYAKVVDPYGSYTSRFEMFAYAVILSYVSDFWKKLDYLAGVGVQAVNIPIDNKKGNPPAGLFIKAGLEFKPQSRIGLGLNLNYELRKISVYSNQNTKILELNPLSIESTLAFYF